MTTTTESFINRLREDLQNARKTRDSIRMQALRSLIARIDNAEAIQSSETDLNVDNQFFAGAKAGVGSTEAERKTLTTQDIKSIIASEIEEIESTLNELGESGPEDHKIELLAKLAFLRTIERG